jgi:hypothetical protein
MEEEVYQMAAEGEDLVSSDLRGELLAHIGDRLNAGEALISHAQFQKAMEEGYRFLRGTFPSQAVKERLGAIVREAAAENPEALVIPGIENWITRTVLGQVRKNSWGIAQVQTEGQHLLRDLIRQDQVRTILAQFELTPAQLNIRNCMRSIANAVAGKEDPKKKRAAARLAQMLAALKKETGAPASGSDRLQQLLSGPAALPDEEEAAGRTQEQKQVQARLRQEQMQHLMQHLDAYVQQGRLSAEDAEHLRKLHRIDQAVQSGQVSREKGSKIRNSILTGQARDRIEKKVREEVDYVVVYTQVFEALKRIEPKCDPGLRFLIRHKEAVNAQSREEVDWKAMVNALIDELDSARLLIGMMDRQDAEVRMIAARLPPYSYVVRRGHERLENLVIEERFVEELRQLSPQEIAARLSAPDRKERSAAAAAMLSLNALVNRLIKATPFRKELRLFKINLIVEEFYRSTDNLEEARQRAQEFMRTRLHSLYPDMTEEETAEIQQRSSEIIASVEQKILAERAQEPAAPAAEATGEDEKEDDRISEEELKKGVQIGRVAIRAGGSTKLVPYKIMPDPDDAKKFVLARRDADTGEVVPVMRRGSRRYVEKNKEGIWELMTK